MRAFAYCANQVIVADAVVCILEEINNKTIREDRWLKEVTEDDAFPISGANMS